MEKIKNNNGGSTHLSTVPTVEVGKYYFGRYFPNVFSSKTFDEVTGRVTFYSSLRERFNEFYGRVSKYINPETGKYNGCLIIHYYHSVSRSEGLYCTENDDDFHKCSHCIFHFDKSDIPLSRGKLWYYINLLAKSERVSNDGKREKQI